MRKTPTAGGPWFQGKRARPATHINALAMLGRFHMECDMQGKRQEQQRQAVRNECERRGISITRSGKSAFRLVGTGVDMLVADLAFVDLANLAPAMGRAGWL